MLSLLGSFFEQRDWLVMRATHTAGAALLYERERPDVVVLDLEFPRMSGLLERAVL